MRRLLVAVCLAALVAVPSTAHAQVDLGGQLSWGDDADFGIGGRVVLGLPFEQVPLEVIGTFDYFFPDEGPGGADVTYWELNANIVYRIPVRVPMLTPYAGTGINIAHVSVDTDGVDASDTEVGINLLGGAKYDAGPVTPFAELRFELDGGEQFVLSLGVLFNVGPGL
ncbi:MAG: outer membrane beta-barrel protein [Gemmatimonadota bacterium]|nr:MAG: outer membrane beta-barrel protein [Gemmatimonadota bacterium]